MRRDLAAVAWILLLSGGPALAHDGGFGHSRRTIWVTAELDAFFTTASNCTVPPWKGCAEVGVTETVTAGGGGGGGVAVEAWPEPAVLHEEQITQSKREAKRHARDRGRHGKSRGVG